MSKQQKSIAENSDHESMALDENNSHDSSVSEHSTSEEEVEEMTDSEDSDAKRKRTRKMDNSADFAAALDRVLSMSLNQQETQVPVMAKNRVVERRLEEERLERKARKVLAAERNAKLQQGRRRLVDPDEVALTLEYEKRLKKVATRGVIQLFNAVRTHQKSGEDALAPLVVATTKAKEKGKFKCWFLLLP
ncbi:Rrp15p-domain-containing protein [Syncephalis plumigaleata]|nr:Rrp15p-domain-containing protein [Syncephalis plumigaleata]